MLRAAAIAVLAVLAGPVSAATAAPPANDSPVGAGAFAPYTAANGTPHEQQAVAELAEATPDPGVPRCLGDLSFARTVWYLVPASEVPQELTVEASGQTLDVVDLAAFVQPPPSGGPPSLLPNACSGLGGGGADAAQEPTSGLSLRVPAGRAVLIEVGRHGPVGTPDNERAVLSLDATPITLPFVPPGDAADQFTPRVGTAKPAAVLLGGATTTEEDPAQPACPSLGSVWRRLEPGRAGALVISASGYAVGTLTVFAGPRPTAANALDCVNREGAGSLQMRVQAKAHKPLWIRIGTDQPADDSQAIVSVQPGDNALVIDGGPGGSDPTVGGPGGGYPATCFSLRRPLARAGIAGPGFNGAVKSANRRPNVLVALTVRGGPVCDVQLQLYGPRGQVYASAQAISLKGRRLVRLARVRKLVRGGYRLKVTALSELGKLVSVATSLRGKLS